VENEAGSLREAAHSGMIASMNQPRWSSDYIGGGVHSAVWASGAENVPADEWLPRRGARTAGVLVRVQAGLVVDRSAYDVPARLEPRQLRPWKREDAGVLHRARAAATWRASSPPWTTSRARLFLECDPLPGPHSGWSDLVHDSAKDGGASSNDAMDRGDHSPERSGRTRSGEGSGSGGTGGARPLGSRSHQREWWRIGSSAARAGALERSGK